MLLRKRPGGPLLALAPPMRPASQPTLVSPATKAASIIEPDDRVSHPITTKRSLPGELKKCPTALPKERATSTVIGWSFTRPRTPSVPNNLRDTGPASIHSSFSVLNVYCSQRWWSMRKRNPRRGLGDRSRYLPSVGNGIGSRLGSGR